MVVLDWDGAAVSDRRTDVSALARDIEGLLQLNVPVVVITGKELGSVDRGLCSRLSGSHKGNLFVCVNRGSKIYGFDGQGKAVLLHRRAKTEQEEGLSDKWDSIGWCVDALAIPHGIGLQDILIVSDGVAAAAGTSHGNAYMRAAAIVSLQRKPKAGRDGAIWLGRGIEGLRRLLQTQRSLRLAQSAPPAPDPAWDLTERGFEPEREPEIESVLTIGNGYLGVRGAVEGECPPSQPATFVAGVFDMPSGPYAVPELFTAPNWLNVQVSVDGEPLTLTHGTVLSHERTLDMRRAILRRDWRHQQVGGRVTHLRTVRFASLADRHVVVHRIEITPEDYSGRAALTIYFDRAAMQSSTVLRAGPLAPGEARWHELVVATETQQTDIRLAIGERNVLLEDGQPVRAAHAVAETRVGTEERWEWEATAGTTYVLERAITFYTSRDGPDPVAAASNHLVDLRDQTYSELLAAHTEAWRRRWDIADIAIDGDREAQHAARFAAYHLIIASNPEDEGVSIGARTLSGTGYRGHVFWDTEIFMLPFFTYTDPLAARALLSYRYHTLPEARRKAAQFGYRGALFAWESADSGAEATPPAAVGSDGEVVPILCGQHEHHISADVAYAVWQYWQATQDEAFFLAAGAEVLLECARFWASRATRGADGRYHIRGVMGPDEYHDIVDDNAYTNVMAAWTLERGMETARWLESQHSDTHRAIAQRIGLSARELRRWETVAGGLTMPYDPDTKLVEQFAGYFKLEDIDPTVHLDPTLPLEGVFEEEHMASTQLLKQADVLMLFHLLDGRFDGGSRRANLRYYGPRTIHGSSLSLAIHAIVAARLAEVRLARRYFGRAMDIDSMRNVGSLAGGVHAAAQGGLWQAIIHGFAGMRVEGDVLTFDPHLPPEWKRLAFRILWRGRRMGMVMRNEPRVVEVTLEAGEPIELRVGSGGITRIEPLRRYLTTRRDGRWSPLKPAPGRASVVP